MRRVVPLCLAAVLVGCERPEIATVGARVPEYAARDLDGAALRLADLRGEVVLLNVWATWCFPCRREMPALEELHRELGERGLRVVAVSVDAGDAGAQIREFLDELGLTMQVLHDPTGEIGRRFARHGVPETFLIGADGTLHRHWLGRIDARSESVRGPVRAALALR